MLILIVSLPLLLFALKHGKANADKTSDENEWYDENGNHIYYDRKLIRFLARKAAVRRSNGTKYHKSFDKSNET